MIDVTFTGGSSHILCREQDSTKRRLFSIGNNDFGQLGNDNSLSSHDPVEITSQFPEEVLQIASGGYHTLAITQNDMLYGFGKLSKGQFGTVWTAGKPKFAAKPERIQIPEGLEPSKVYAGSLFSMLEVTDPTK